MSATGKLRRTQREHISSGSLLKADIARCSWHVREGPSPCEIAKTLDRDRTNYSFNAALAAQAASQLNFEIEPENIILDALRFFEFSHSLGPEADHGLLIKCSSADSLNS
jgi:hypothetical protein